MGVQPRSRSGPSVLLALAGALAAAACTVVPIEADRAAKALRNGDFDADAYVEANWSSRAVPEWTKRARPLPELLQAADADADAAGRSYGRQTGEGSPWVFVTTVEGRVSAVDRDRRAGRATVEVPGVARPVEIQIGPVIGGFALRDSLPFVDFDDFPNQIAYADAGRAMTDRALGDLQAGLNALQVGDAIVLTGVFPYAGREGAVVVTPTAVVERPGGRQAPT